MRCSPVQHRSTVRPDAYPRTGITVRGRLHLWQPGPVGFDQGLQSCKPHSLRPETQTWASKGGFGAPIAPPPENTCPCGTRKLYRECCQPFHSGAAVPATAEDQASSSSVTHSLCSACHALHPAWDAVLLQVRARFSGYVKAEEKYLLSTFAPEYLQFKYPELPAEEAAKQLKRDVKMACEVFVEFRYESIKRGVDKRTNNKNQRMKTPPPEKNIDGSIKIGKTHERSRFVMEGPTWKFASYELLEFPDWLQEAKDAEVKAAEAKAGTDKEPVPAPA
ncbi:uncharacterized protein HaLaN_28021 [Haematococcus lacustris]|uniref:YchJ-like middle NTF2-like domain-containing protein n=2 Tax=Haematococcus lacustris TaxID=44745 RepID=A0A6A0ABE3_HAELA|nr:uncharacterized protein HaLaN_28021 [Haematococcus lacustris]